MTKTPNTDVTVLQDQWMIRPCYIYDEEHSECTSVKGRFHQYFVHGESVECGQWKTDYKNCKLWNSIQDETAFKALIESEHKRRMERLGPHYANTVWKKRRTPPKDWNKPLPEWMQKQFTATYLELKATELRDGTDPTVKRQLCLIS